MNTTNPNNTAAPSVTIAPRNPSRRVITYIVTLTTFEGQRSYPCRSLESAMRLADRFIAGVVHQPAEASQITEQEAADAANPELYLGPARTAEQVSA